MTVVGAQHLYDRVVVVRPERAFDRGVRQPPGVVVHVDDDLADHPIWTGLITAYADALRRSRRHGHLLHRISGTVETTDQLPDTTPSGQALFWSDSTILLRDADARRLGEEVREWYENAQRVSSEARDDRTARRYLCLAAPLPSEAIHS